MPETEDERVYITATDGDGNWTEYWVTPSEWHKMLAVIL
jgi:hypothetical protein